jgi:predicted GIY-YIG superfamily endonuclease
MDDGSNLKKDERDPPLEDSHHRPSLRHRGVSSSWKVIIMENNERWYVYIIQENSTRNIKVGYGKDVESRLSEIQVGNPRKLSIIYKEKFENQPEARKSEKILHNHLILYAIGGEWFEYRKDREILILGLKTRGIVGHLGNGYHASCGLDDNYKEILKALSFSVSEMMAKDDFDQLRAFSDKLEDIRKDIYQRTINRKHTLYRG